MKAIYETRGKAREYCRYACNLYTGCTCQCQYCYAPGVLRKSRQAHAADVRPRPGILEALQRDAAKLAEREPGAEVLLSFTCDPFPAGWQHMRDAACPDLPVTLAAIECLSANGLVPRLLTKRPPGVEYCPALVAAQAKWGMSLAWWHGGLGFAWEPEAYMVEHRRVACEHAKRVEGLYTWLSVEPVIVPADALEVIAWAITEARVDEIHVGKLNHMPLPKAVDWGAFVKSACLLMEIESRARSRHKLPPLRWRIKDDTWALTDADTRQRYRQADGW
jgi:DNA repair photolyase